MQEKAHQWDIMNYKLCERIVCKSIPKMQILSNLQVLLVCKLLCIQSQENIREQETRKCDFSFDNDVKLKNHMKAGHTLGNIIQIYRNSLICEEVLESLEDSRTNE